MLLHPDDDRVIRTILETRAIEPDSFFEAYQRWNQTRATPLSQFLIEAGYLSTHDLDRFASTPSEQGTEPGSPRVDGHIATTVGPGDGDQTCDFGRPDTTDSGFQTSSDAFQASGQDRFEKRSYIDRGGQGEIWKAYDHELNRVVAWKQVREEFSSRDDLRIRLFREATTMASLDHPGIVPVYGLGVQANGTPYYTMRFVEGTNLDKEIKDFHALSTKDAHAPSPQRRLRLRDFLNRFIAVCNTIQYAHDRSLLHRDLKPENVRIGPLSETLVMDWGLTKHLRTLETIDLALVDSPSTEHDLKIDLRLTHTDTILGSYGYISPEAARSEHHLVGPATDIWGLGCILYAILTGRSPYQGLSFPNFLLAAKCGKLATEPLKAPTVPPALAAVVVKALRPLPEDRYPSASALAHEVERWLADESVSEYPDHLIIKASRFARRHRTAVAASIAILLTAIPILSVYNYRLAQTNVELERSYRAYMNTHEPASREVATTFFNNAERLWLEHPGTDYLVYEMYDSGVSILRTLAGNAPPETLRNARIALAKRLVAQASLMSQLKGYADKADGRFIEAIDIGESELAVNDTGDDLRLELAGWYLSRAEHRSLRQELHKAGADYEQSLAHCRLRRQAVADERRAEILEARILYNQASYLARIDRLEQALAKAREARTLLEAINRRAHPQEYVGRWLTQACKVEGVVQHRRKDHVAARACFDSALTLLSAMDAKMPDRDYLIADASHWLGRVDRSIGSRDSALKLLTHAEQLMRSELADPRKLRLGRTETLLHQVLCNRAMILLASAQTESETSQAQAVACEGLRLAEECRQQHGGSIELDELEAETCTALADSYRRTNDPSQANSLQARAEKARQSLVRRRRDLSELPVSDTRQPAFNRSGD